jgi:transposase
MSSQKIPEATPIILTPDERAELKGLVRSTKTEHRTRFKARIILLAAGGASTRAIARGVGCAIGTAPKWRVRYAKDRRTGFSETGNRGPKPKYGSETGQRILALLDTKPPPGYANWTAPLLAKALCDVHEQYIWISGDFCGLRILIFPAASPGARATTPILVAGFIGRAHRIPPCDEVNDPACQNPGWRGRCPMESLCYTNFRSPILAETFVYRQRAYAALWGLMRCQL